LSKSGKWKKGKIISGVIYHYKFNRIDLVEHESLLHPGLPTTEAELGHMFSHRNWFLTVH